MIKAVVFDLDGALVDSGLLWDAARREVVNEHGGESAGMRPLPCRA